MKKRFHAKKFKRPDTLTFTVIDPFDGFKLFVFKERYEPEECARGLYRISYENCRETGKFIANNLYKRGVRPALKMRIPKVFLNIA